MSFVEELLQEAEEIFAAKKPIEQEVIVGQRVVTVRVPVIRPQAFDDLSGRCLPRPNVPQELGLGFSLTDVARNYPGVTLVDGATEDDMRSIKGDEIVYRWPAVYDALSFEDRKTLQTLIWGMHFWDADQAKAKAKSGSVDV